MYLRKAEPFRSKDEQWFTNLWKTVNKLWNNFRIMFLNVNCIDFEYLIIYSKLYHQKIKRIWRNLCVQLRDKVKIIIGRCDLWDLMHHCTQNRHDSVMGITAWAQKHLQNSLSVNIVRRFIHKYRIYHKKKPYVNMIRKCCRVLWAKAQLKWTEQS